MKTLLAMLIVAASASAQTFHVTGVRNWAATDPAPVSHAFRVYVITGNVGDKAYTAQQLFSWGSQHFEAGADYEVIKSDAQSLTIEMHDKKGHNIKERLDVVGVEEAKK
jgi:hypothetical protein